jgi:DNA repair ATPase RecN
MSATRKPRGDAKLKTLPEARQEQIAEMLSAQTLAEVKRELAADGLDTSLEALSQFYSWWQLKQTMASADSMAEELIERLKAATPDLEINPERLFSVGQMVFETLALQQKSTKDWKRVQDVAHRRQLVQLARQKFQRDTCELFLRWQADQRALEIAASGGLLQSEKIERLGQLMFGDDWSQATAKD